MTKLQIIAKLWSIIFDLLLLTKGQSNKMLEQIEHDIDVAEYHCRKSVDTEDDELAEHKKDECPKDILPF